MLRTRTTDGLVARFLEVFGPLRNTVTEVAGPHEQTGWSPQDR